MKTVASKVEAKLRTEWEAEQSEKQKTGALKASDKAVKGRSGPTGVAGGAPPPRGDLSTMDPRTPEYAKAYRAKYGFDP